MRGGVRMRRMQAGMGAGVRARVILLLLLLLLSVRNVAGLGTTTSYSQQFSWASNTGSWVCSSSQDPGAAVSDKDWLKTARTESDDFECPTASSLRTHSLSCFLASFDVPTNASVDGVELSVRREVDGSGNGGYADVRMVLLNGASEEIGNPKALSWPTSYATSTYGGPSDGWGADLTGVVVSSPAFGFRMVAAGTQDRTLYMDKTGGNAPTMTIYYSLTRVIETISPSVGSASDLVVLTGGGFQGANKGESGDLRCSFGTVTFPGVATPDGTTAVCAAPSETDVGVGPEAGWTVPVSVSVDDGTTWSNVVNFTYAGCGNGIVDAGEDCDGNGVCCSSTCLFLEAGSLCRAAAVGSCDAEETCSGASVDCPADEALPAGSACGSSGSGVCGVPGQCMGGGNKTCPGPSFRAAGDRCAIAGDCGVDSVCSGSSFECPPIALLPLGAVCREEAPCAFASACDGASDICPPSPFKTSLCREAVSPCDAPEVCLGNSTMCPPDTFSPAGTVCGPSPSVCASDAVCTGTSPTCPPPVFAPAGTPCRPANGSCDVAETCTGDSASCPFNVYRALGEVCEAPRGPCEEAARCTGREPECPPRTFSPATSECRPATGPCDAAEFCTGSSLSCPPDALLAAGSVCAQDSICEAPLICTGTEVSCTVPDGSFEPSDDCAASAAVAGPPSSSSGAIAGASVAGAILVCCCLAGGGAFFMWKRRQAAEQARYAKPDLDPFRYFSYSRLELSPVVASRVAGAEALAPLLVADASAGFPLVNALLDSMDVGDLDHASKALVYAVAGARPGAEVDLVCSRIRAEVSVAPDEGTLFRTNSGATKLMQVYARMVGLDYLWECVGLHIVRLHHKLIESGEDLELDASRGAADSDASLNKYLVSAVAQKLLASLVDARKDMPRGLVAIVQTLHRTVLDRFGPVGAVRGVSGFLFLRFVCPSISAPESVGFLPQPPEPGERRKLVLITKLLQNLANKVRFGSKESFMMPLNEFIDTNEPVLDHYVSSLVSQGVQDEEEARGCLIPEGVVAPALGVLHGFLAAVAGRETSVLCQTLQELAPLPVMNVVEGGALGAGAGADDEVVMVVEDVVIGGLAGVDGIGEEEEEGVALVDLGSAAGPSDNRSHHLGEEGSGHGSGPGRELIPNLSSAMTALEQLVVVLEFCGEPVSRPEIMRGVQRGK